MTDWVQKQLERIHQEEAQKGGPGSGHHGHAGRPGKRGGSTPGKGGGGGGTGSPVSAEDIEGAIDEARVLVNKMKPKDEWTGNLASYGRHIQPAHDALDAAFDIIKKDKALSLKEWQRLVGKYNRVRAKFDRLRNEEWRSEGFA